MSQICETYISPIAEPLADKLLGKYISKLLKQCSEEKLIHTGLRSVQRCIRKDQKGLIFLASSANPIETIAHIPALCEDYSIPYCFVLGMIPCRGENTDELKSSVIFCEEPKTDNEVYAKIYKALKA